MPERYVKAAARAPVQKAKPPMSMTEFEARQAARQRQLLHEGREPRSYTRPIRAW